MAQFAHESGQQGGPFGYTAEWPAQSSLFTNFGDTMNQPAILSQDDTSFLASFFQNPDSANMDDDPFSGMSWPADLKLDSSALESQLTGYDQHSQTVSNPAVTLAGSKDGSYATHSSQQHIQRPTQMAENFGLDSHQASEDDFNAASGLFNLSAHGHLSHAQDASSMSAPASWGNIATNHPMMAGQDINLHSPMTSSGRLSSNSHHSQPLNPSFNPHLHSGQPQLDWSQMWHHPPLQTTSRLPPASAQMTADPGYTFTYPLGQVSQTQSAHPTSNSFPGLSNLHFGSDGSFGEHGFRPPTGWTPLEHEKGANLNEVPLAAQAAGHRQSHAQTFTPNAHSHTLSRHGLPSGSPPFFNPVRSPTTHTGLPITSPISANHHHSHPFKQFNATPNEIDNVEDNDLEINPTRKRRKSQMERADDAEYTPPTHVKTTLPKRRFKGADGSDTDDDDHYVTPASKKATIKRRKSTARVPSSDIGEEDDVEFDDSPSALRSESGEPATSTKRKVRKSTVKRSNLTEAQKRQNHINSEKSRRDLIKVHYETLDELVPGLKGGKAGLSRADVLKEIVDYVETTVAGNEMVLQEMALKDGAGTGNSDFG